MQVFPEYTSPVMGALEQKVRERRSVNASTYYLPIRSGAPLKGVKRCNLIAELGIEENVAWTAGLVLPNVIFVAPTVHEIISRRHVARTIVEVKTIVTLPQREGRMMALIMSKFGQGEACSPQSKVP